MSEMRRELIFSVVIAFVVGSAAVILFTPETRTAGISVPYDEPVYETRYSGTLKDTGITTTSWTITDATSYTNDYTGKDLWGQGESLVKVCWGSNCQNFPQINYLDITSHDVFIGFQTKYRTEYKQVTKTRLEWILED